MAELAAEDAEDVGTLVVQMLSETHETIGALLGTHCHRLCHTLQMPHLFLELFAEVSLLSQRRLCLECDEV